MQESITGNGISLIASKVRRLLRNEIRYGTLARWKSGFERFTERELYWKTCSLHRRKYKIVERLSNRVENTGDQPRLFHRYSVFFVLDLRWMSGKKKNIIRADTGGERESRGGGKKKEKSLYNFSCNCPRHFYPTRQLLFIIIVGTGLFIILLFMTTARYR